MTREHARDTPESPRVVIVGAGITGLAAAHWLLRGEPRAQITILEASERVGGKLHSHVIAGAQIDVGAESILASSTHARELLDDLGLTEQIVHPEPISAGIYSHGAVHPVPERTFFGVPSASSDLSGVLDPAELAQAARPGEPVRLAGGGDVSVREAISAEYGDAVVDRIVEPLMGGIYAGRAEELSLRATMKALAAGLESDSLRATMERLLPMPTGGQSAQPRPPALMSITGSLARLPQELADSLMQRGATIQFGCAATSIDVVDGHWLVRTSRAGSQGTGEPTQADAVILASPASASASVLEVFAPGAAQPLEQISCADMVIVTMAFAKADCPELVGSGFLVPSIEGMRIKASTFSTNKWAALAESEPDLVLLRASLGRAGEPVREDDEGVIHLALADLEGILGTRMPHPIRTHVQRWSAGIPQYTLGHTDRISAARAALAQWPSLQLAGASYDGVGIASCLSSAAASATAVLDALTLKPTATTPEKESK